MKREFLLQISFFWGKITTFPLLFKGGVLRCQAQLELTLMMCLSDRSTSTGTLSDRSTSTGALSDRSMFTSTDARATDLRHCFFGGFVVI